MLFLALGLLAWRGQAGRLRLAGVMEYPLALLVAGLNALFGLALLVFDGIPWKELGGGNRTKLLAAMVRGLLLTLPLLLIFGGLFMAADAHFEQFVHNLFHLDMEALAVHLASILFVTWVVGGFLRQTLRDNAAEEEADWEKWPRLSLGSVEVLMALGMLNLLFAGFVALQARYLFGGQEMVRATAGLTSADYARRGFFELVTVAALMLPLLLLLDWLLRRESRRSELLFNCLSGGLVLLSGAVMASAVQRMLLYHAAYGLTELRFYTTTFMGWLALVFLWFLITVLRGQRRRFVFGAMVSGFAVVGLLHLLNPDALIVRANTDRVRMGKSFDVVYNASLSADAVPALLEAMPSLPQTEQVALNTRLQERVPAWSCVDWRSWNLSVAQANRLLKSGGLRGQAAVQQE